MKIALLGLRNGTSFALMVRSSNLFLLLITTGKLALFGQSLSAGVKGGVRATDDFQNAATSESRRYVVGPMAILDLPHGLGVEIDALYRRQGYRTAWSSPLSSSSLREADDIWEFPLLVRYRIPLSAIHPFAEAGWAPRITHGVQDVSGAYLNGLMSFTYYSGRRHMDWPLTHGVVVGGGIQFATGRLQFAPEVRYTHWNQQAIYGYFADGPSYSSNENQLDVLLGISWRIGTRTR
jgi:hypothetical protein